MFLQTATELALKERTFQVRKIWAYGIFISPSPSFVQLMHIIDTHFYLL